MKVSTSLLQCFLAASFRLSFASRSVGNPQHPLSLDVATINSSSLLSLHRELVEIESISGNEQRVGHYLQRYLEDHNFTVETQHVGALGANEQDRGQGSVEKHPRFNLLAYSGEARNSRILVSSHIDTVPPYFPYEVRGHDDIWGRGSVDAKGCIATQITAIEDLRASGETKDGDVALLFVVGEEVGGDGMRKVNDLGMKWETVIFGEPTELKLASGHKGYLGISIKAKGKAGHSGYPWLGENANSMLIPALAALDKLELPSSEKYGNTTLNIGRMEGGVAGNVIAEISTAQITLRVAAGSIEDLKKIVLDAVKKVDDRLEVEFSGGAYGPVYIDSDVEGFDTITVNYGTDIPNLNGSHKRYLYGPGSILVAHSDHEHVNTSDLKEAVDGYKKLILGALKS